MSMMNAIPEQESDIVEERTGTAVQMDLNLLISLEQKMRSRI